MPKIVLPSTANNLGYYMPDSVKQGFIGLEFQRPSVVKQQDNIFYETLKPGSVMLMSPNENKTLVHGCYHPL